MTYVSYWEKLKDPRWQKKRLRILERAEFACEDCGDESSTLHVHHRIYIRGRDPWDYPDEMLQCLCEHCHDNVTALMEELHYIIADDSTGCLLETIIGFAKGWVHRSIPSRSGSTLSNYEAADGFAAAFGLTADDLIALIPKGCNRPSDEDFQRIRNEWRRRDGMSEIIPERMTTNA